ncbi:hypothetical protein F8M41_003523 [Gigaspora margarita]|uniref:Uncharacterized protein n=1 Tax=Gigaspora margarita TaxID=4874 RepID=A0A8H3XCL5_GIGMA|nr:hypothetical protein F8M41_003523 [Gigaspora margarita]
MSEHIVAYLRQYKNRSFWGFLLRYQNEIVATTLPTSRWEDLNNDWVTNFIREARKLGEDLEGKVIEDRKRYNFEDYWSDVINECKIRRDISECKVEKERILHDLMKINDELKIKEDELTRILNKRKIHPKDSSNLDEDLMQSSSTINEDYRHESFADYGTGSNDGKNSDNNTMQSSSIINEDYSFADYGTGSNNDDINSDNYSNNNNHNSIVDSSVQQKKRVAPISSHKRNSRNVRRVNYNNNNSSNSGDNNHDGDENNNNNNNTDNNDENNDENSNNGENSNNNTNDDDSNIDIVGSSIPRKRNPRKKAQINYNIISLSKKSTLPLPSSSRVLSSSLGIRKSRKEESVQEVALYIVKEKK